MAELPKTPPQPVTEAQLEWINEQGTHHSNKVLRKYRRSALVGYLALVLGLGVAIHGNTEAIKDSKARSLSARNTLCALIRDGDQATYRYGHEGTLTPAQVRRALRDSAHARKTLGPAPNCTATITPEAKKP